MVEALAVQLTQREGELIQEKAEVKKLANFLKQASEDARKIVDEERAFARAEIDNARSAVQRVEEALQEHERMSQASGKQDVEQLMKEVQEARRIKMLHQPSKVMDMEHELRALRAQLAEKTRHYLRLQKELTRTKRGEENVPQLYELEGNETLGSYLQIQPCSDNAPEVSKCSIQWCRVSSDGAKKELISGATKSVYAPEPFDVGRILQVDIISEREHIVLSTTGPIDPAAGLGTYVEALVRKHDTEFNVLVTQMNGLHHPTESIHILHVGKMRMKLCKGKTTIAKAYYSSSMQLCGVRGGGNAAAQAIFWQPKQGQLYREEKPEEPDLPKYRDRAKERREDQNPDYEQTELGFHAVAPPGSVDIGASDAHKLSIEKSKYLGGDVEHTHLVKGLDYALLNKVRSEIDKKPEAGDDGYGKSRASKEDQQVSIRTATAKSVYQWIVKPQTISKTNEMFLPGRMTFIFNMEGGYHHDIPTTLHRSKADCPVPEEMVTVNVDGSVLDRIAKIMSYLRLGSSGKVLKKKKKEKDVKGKIFGAGNGYDKEDKLAKVEGVGPKNQTERESILPPPPPLKKNPLHTTEIQGPPVVARPEDDDIFVGEGVNYEIPGKDLSQSPVSEDMEESPGNKERPTYFTEPSYGPIPPSMPPQGWQETNGYDAMQTQAMVGGYQGEWPEYQYAEQLAYPDQYLQQNMQAYDVQAGADIPQDPRFMTQEEKDRGLGSVFKRDDQRLQQLREKDAREKDPNFISDSYSECYPGYQEYNREVVDSDDEADLSKMDMGGRAKGRLHRWDFETEEEWATYNEQKEAMPKAAFQFGVKMQDGRKTRKQNKDQKLNNDLHKINKILARKKMDKESNGEADHYDDEPTPGKKLRV